MGAHPVFALWPLGLRDDLATDAAVPDPFFNVNTPADLALAETLAG